MICIANHGIVKNLDAEIEKTNFVAAIATKNLNSLSFMPISVIL